LVEAVRNHTVFCIVDSKHDFIFSQRNEAREKNMPESKLSVVVDVCLLVAALTGTWRIWDVHHDGHRAFTESDPRIGIVGKTLRNTDINWNKTGANLVMVMNKDCHFCSESAPFYRQLITSTGERVQVVALFPHDIAAAETYLNHLALMVPLVRGSVSFPWQVMTPTLMLCDSTGKVTRVWIGKLSGAEESEVLSAVKNLNAAQRSCRQAICGGLPDSD
jgi:hypothetical protein